MPQAAPAAGRGAALRTARSESRRRSAALLPCLLLLTLVAGCAGDPCAEPGAERDLSNIRMLIRQTEADLDRGYRETGTDSGASLGLCLGNATPSVGLSFCSERALGQPRVAPIDRDSETRKLEQLKAREKTLSAQLSSDRLVCRASQPPA